MEIESMLKLAITSCSIAIMLSMSNIALSESYALIMTVGEYQRPGISQLKGTRYDAVTATEVAKRLGVQQRNITSYSDSQITRINVLRYFDQLAEKMEDGDQAFIYYSGHGSRSQIVEVDKKGFPKRCAEAFVAVDGEMIYDYDVEDALKKITAKAHRVFMMVDACHSGGVAKRSKESDGFIAKFSATNDDCSKPINMLTRAATQGAAATGKGGNNLVVIAAARDNEVAFDLPNGGLATTSIKQCLFSGLEIDTDRSGAVSWEELGECAQKEINRKITGVEKRPHHITLHGNAKAVAKFDPTILSSTTANPTSVSSPPVPSVTNLINFSPTSHSGNLPQLPLSALTNQSPLAVPATFNTLLDIHQQRDDRRNVKLTLKQEKFRINRDFLEFSVESQQDGFLYILAAGSDGKTIDILFPNRLDQDNRIKAGSSMKLPREDWMIEASGPPGRNRLLAIVSDSERSFSALPLVASGPFSSVTSGVKTQSDIQSATTLSANSSLPHCSSSGTKRNFVIARQCSNRFGSAIVDAEEIK